MCFKDMIKWFKSRILPVSAENTRWELRRLKIHNRVFVFLSLDNLKRVLNKKRIRIAAYACLFTAVVILSLLLSINKPTNQYAKGQGQGETASNTVLENQEEDETQQKEGTPEKEEKVLPIIDLSDNAIDVETAMLRINEPTACDRELVYSAGNASNIDEPVFTKLFLYNIDTGEETVVAESQIKFGEIYEGRFNKDWIVWLDTNQSGTNNIYVLNRKTGEVSRVKRCDLNKPKLVLYGDNLVWVEQKDEESDRLYLYNFKSGEPVSLESFNNPTYGTCPPTLYNDILVWVYPHPGDPERSIIKKLDLKQALSVQTAAGQTGMEESVSDDSLGNQQGEGGADGDNEIQQTASEGVEPEIIDPKGFAIYPQSNGQVIAWLDNLDPSKAKLMMTRDDGQNITVVAESVGRLFGVGDKFIVYTQDDAIMLYFWEIDRYARLTKPGEKAMLSQMCVSGNTVVWYDVNDPARKKDQVKISIVEQPSL